MYPYTKIFNINRFWGFYRISGQAPNFNYDWMEYVITARTNVYTSEITDFQYDCKYRAAPAYLVQNFYTGTVLDSNSDGMFLFLFYLQFIFLNSFMELFMQTEFSTCKLYMTFSPRVKNIPLALFSHINRKEVIFLNDIYWSNCTLHIFLNFSVFLNYFLAIFFCFSRT